MTRFFVSGTGLGSGTLTFRGRTYPFTLIGSLNGLGALATTQASGEVYKLSDISQFPGAWIQGNGNLAVSTLANGELWLQNNHGVVMRLSAQQAGITLSNGRYEFSSTWANSGASEAGAAPSPSRRGACAGARRRDG